MPTLVIRFSSLGDVVLAGAVTGALGEVWFWTKAAWHDVAARLPGVTRVIALEGGVIPDRVDRIVDLQASPRSRWLAARVRGPVQRVRRHDLRRRSRVWFKLGAPPPRVVDRYARAAGVQIAPHPWLDLGPPGEAIALIPGAAWGTKRWPMRHWVSLAHHLEGPLNLLGGVADRPLLDELSAAIGPRATVVAERGFDRTFDALADTRLAIGGDTGLLHLAAAAGRPVVGLFGPTRSDDGFWCHPGAALERDLPCRPCSRHGSDRCPIGDQLCLEDIGPDEVFEATKALNS